MPIDTLRFFFRNSRVNDDETPKLLNMMDGDVIQVFPKGKGCSADDAMYDIVDRITEFDSSLRCRIVKIVEKPQPISLSSCPKGHIVFQVYWKPRLTSCFTCGGELLPTMLPESSFENILHKCKFYFNGCTVKLRPKYLEMHESDCLRKGIYCQNKDVITIKIIGQESEVHYRIGKTTKFHTLNESYNSKMGLRFHLLFDGRRINYLETPLSFDMDNGDVIEAFQEQCGS